MITGIQRVDTSGAVPNCYYFYVGQFSVYHIMSYIDNCMYHRRFQIRASPGIARVKFWSIVLIAYHYIVLRDDGEEFSDGKTV